MFPVPTRLTTEKITYHFPLVESQDHCKKYGVQRIPGVTSLVRFGGNIEFLVEKNKIAEFKDYMGQTYPSAKKVGNVFFSGALSAF